MKVEMARWYNRKASLAEFIEPLPKKGESEDLNIEWSSSDEEVPAHPSVPITHLSKPSTTSDLPVKIEKGVSITSVKDWSYSEVDSKDLLLGSCSGHTSAINEIKPFNIPNINRQRTPLDADFSNRLLFNTGCLNASDYHHYETQVSKKEELKICLSSSISSKCYDEHVLISPSAVHAAHSQRAVDDDEYTISEPCSPVLGLKKASTELCSPVFQSKKAVAEPCSPVLGLKRFVTEPFSPVIPSKKVVTEPCSPIFGSHKTAKRKLVLSNIAAVKRQIGSDTPNKLFLGIGSGVMGKVASNSESSTCLTNLNDINNGSAKSNITHKTIDNAVEQLEDNKYCGDISQENGVASTVQPLLQPTLFGSTEEKHEFNCSGDCLSEEIVQSSSVENQQHDRTDNICFHLLTPRRICLQQENTQLCDDGSSCASQNIACPSEGGESQLDYITDVAQTPSRKSLYDIPISEDSSDSGTQGKVGVSTPPPAGQAANTKSGFNWVRSLHTPQKPSSSENAEGGMESAKKKFLRDGQAERLQRLLVSWQSGVNVWSHGMSLTTLFKGSPQQGKSQLSSATPSQVGGPRKVDASSLRDNVKAMSSPVVRSLQDQLIESPVSSPGTVLFPHSCAPPSKKYMDLKLVKTGGQLPSNAALCEAVDSNVEGFYTFIKMENADAVALKAEKSLHKRKYLVFFALSEQKIAAPIYTYSRVRVYSPWQNLALPAHDVPVLFTSYFRFQENQQKKESSSNIQLTHRKMVIHSWTCNCSDRVVVQSLCDAQDCAFQWCVGPQANHNQLLRVHSGFTTIQDTPDESPPSSAVLWAGTILEAIEKCGGVSAVPVTVTVRIHRIISHRGASGIVKQWELLGQDARGEFCIVKIPNWPLVHRLRELLAEEGGTHTLTHLTMSQRLTNTQNPGLFSLITSLHNAYQSGVCEDPILQPLLQDQALRPPQTHCYVLTVSLGLTRVLHGGEQVTFPIELPHWSLQEVFQMSCDGQRGNLRVYLLYKTDTSLHVISHPSSQRGSYTLSSKVANVSNNKSKDNGEGEFKEDLLVSRILLMGVGLPPGMPERGPLMLRDAVVWHGSVVVDEYSCIQQEEGNSSVDYLSPLYKLISPLSSQSQQDSLTILSGTIIKVDEESASTYPICSQCKSDKVHEVKDGGIDCLTCGQRSICTEKGYFLEVWLRCGSGLQQATIKVKLYQKTIEKLLSTCYGAQEEYCAASLLGSKVGPLMCVLLQLRRPRRSSIHTYSLAELPY